MKQTRPLDDADEVHGVYDRDTVTKVMEPTRSHEPDITRILTLELEGRLAQRGSTSARAVL
jgi:hypothetical protein